MHNKKQLLRGFTIVEIAVVMLIIGILATITYVAYTGLQARARDVSLQSDLDHMDSIQTSYGIKHNTAGKAYYSINGPDSELAFTPAEGNVVQVVINSTNYCIRGYNPKATKNSISNSAIKESTPGICAALNSTDLPPIPGLTVAQAGGVVTATIIPVSCSGAGTAQYGIRSHTDGGTWTDFSSWSALLTSSQTANYGVTYGYQVQTRCFSDADLISSTVLTPEVSYTHNPLPPSAPTVAVTLNGSSNVQATISSVDSCNIGNEEYAFDYYTNTGSWTGFSAWQSSKNITQVPAQGVQYTYRAQARCVINSSPSDTVIGSAGSPYVAAIGAPSAPTISFSTPDWQGTNWSWNAASCPSGTSADYRIHYYNDYADSGWTSAGSLTTVWRQTSRYQVGYYMQLQARCVNANDPTGIWSAVSNTSPTYYYRDAPVIRVLIVAGGGGGGYDNGGGGGGGGVIDTYISVLQYMQQQTYWDAYIGGGGSPQNNGGDTSFMNLTAIHGGRGGNVGATGAVGGSGGGGGGTGGGNTDYGYTNQPGGWAHIGGRGGNRNGSSCGSGSSYAGGGGGGAGDNNPDSNNNGRGGDAWSGGGGPSQMQGGKGYYFNVNGQTYAAGGGGGGDNCYWGAGGSGIGGNGASGRGNTGGNASYYGSGGGGGSGRLGQGGWGYSGIVIVQSGTGSIPNVTYTGNSTLTISGYY